VVTNGCNGCSVGSGICIRRQAWHRQRHAVRIFQLLRLERHIGYRLAPAGVCTSQAGKADSELSPQSKKAVAASPNKVEVCVGADETLFEQMVLVLLDLSSGYIFLEAQAKTEAIKPGRDGNRRPFSR